MIHIDGSAHSGSGTLVRYAVALSSLLGAELHMDNVRAKRPKPGLRPQHLTSVKACAEMCGAQVKGAVIDSTDIVYRPGISIKGGHYQWDIGTAGSTTLLVMTLLPLALFTDKETVLRITGGLFQDFAPSAHHMQNVLFPLLGKMGVRAELKIIRPGYVPRGSGIVQVSIQPVDGEIKPLRLLEQGRVKKVSGLALSSHLEEQKVSQRMAQECQKVLARNGLQANIETLWDEDAVQAGASLAVWAETDSGCLLGSDQAGQRGRSSEDIGRYVARNLLEDLNSGATVDRHLADQLILYATLAGGTTEYIIPGRTEHVEANIWLAGKFGAKASLEDNTVRIEGLGYKRRSD
jgi:RNA 3'-terminal phosphate cyclase (ATP)